MLKSDSSHLLSVVICVSYTMPKTSWFPFCRSRLLYSFNFFRCYILPLYSVHGWSFFADTRRAQQTKSFAERCVCSLVFLFRVRSRVTESVQVFVELLHTHIGAALVTKKKKKKTSDDPPHFVR